MSQKPCNTSTNELICTCSITYCTIKLKLKIMKKHAEFKYNEITRSFEFFKSLGCIPTLIIETVKSGNFEFAWVEVHVKDTRMMSKIYDKNWLHARIKHYIARAETCPYGEIRMINKRES